MTISPFQPHPLVPGGQLQTIVGHFVSPPFPTAPYETLMVDLPDGDKLQIHIDQPPSSAQHPLVLMLHGLGGCSASRYIQRIGHKLNQKGYGVARFNHRGCGPQGMTLARQIYHAGRIEDIRAALEALTEAFPNRPILVMAFSLSANMVLLLLGKDGELARDLPNLRAALTICPPIDLNNCAQALAARRNLAIDRYYTKRLIRTAHERTAAHPGLVAPNFPARMNLKRFDEFYTAREGGFRDLDEYYSTCSSRPLLKNITIPTTIIAAKDDPIIPPEPLQTATLNSHVTLHMQKSGGHMGFIAKEKTKFKDHRWMDATAVDWVMQQDV